MINYDSSRGGIKVTTENGPTTVSRLRIQNARPTDSGNYSCQPSYADPANITVHVLNGMHQRPYYVTMFGVLILYFKNVKSIYHKYNSLM